MTTPVAPKPEPPRAIVCPICLRPFSAGQPVRLMPDGVWIHVHHLPKKGSAHA